MTWKRECDLLSSTALYDYQLAAIKRVVERKQQAILLEPGDGKTIITLTALCELGAWPALVIAPATVVKLDVWGEEAAKWEHTKNLEVRPLIGTALQRSKAVQAEPAHIETVSYDNVVWLSDELRNPAKCRYKSIIFDELSKVKAPGTKRFRRLRHWSLGVQTRIGLTGTPIGNHLLDLWGEMFMVAGDRPLGPRYTDFKQQYFMPIDFQERVWRLKCCTSCFEPRKGCKVQYRGCKCHETTKREISNRIRPHAYSLPRVGRPRRVPPVRLHHVQVEEPPEVRRLSRALEREFEAELPNGKTLEALGASVVAGKLRQMAGGAVYTGTVGLEGCWEPVHDEKLKALDNLLDELQGASTLVFYWYKHEAERIRGILKGRTWAVLTPDSLQRWNRRELEVLLVHPQSAGHGLNLQAGGRHVVWYTLPWSHELFVQGNGRLARVGQLAPWVTAHLLLCGKVDAWVASTLANKGQMEHDIVNAVRGSMKVIGWVFALVFLVPVVVAVVALALTEVKAILLVVGIVAGAVALAYLLEGKEDEWMSKLSQWFSR